MSHVNVIPFQPTCAFTYDSIVFSAEESLGVVEDELYHHRLDTHLHERCRAAKAGRLDLLGPETQLQNSTAYFTALDHGDMPQFTVTDTREGNRNVSTIIKQFACSSGIIIVQESPEEVRRPDNSQVFIVHVRDGAEGG